MTYVLAIDQGTSGTKAIVVDEAGQVISIAEIALRPDYLPGGGVEQDPEALFASVVDAGRRALDQAGVTVSAVALANQGETVLAWDRRTGRPLTPAIVWQDRRAESICAALAGSADTVAAKTGLVLDPYFSAPKMAWIRESLTRDGAVTTTDTWLIHRLCGAFITDVSTASRPCCSTWTPPSGAPSWWSCSGWPARSYRPSLTATTSPARPTSSGRRPSRSPG